MFNFIVLAYLDPGSGSFLIQLLIGGAVGALFLIKTYWHRIKYTFQTRVLGKDVPPPDMLDDGERPLD